MTIDITLEDIAPYATVPDADKTKVDAWLDAISAILTSRYDTLPSALAPAVFDIVGQAITERLGQASGASPDPRIKSQSIAGASIEYFGGGGTAGVSMPRSSGYFNADQLATLDELLGGGNTRSVRTPAPDLIRYGNLLPRDWYGDALPTEAAL